MEHIQQKNILEMLSIPNIIIGQNNPFTTIYSKQQQIKNLEIEFILLPNQSLQNQSKKSVLSLINNISTFLLKVTVFAVGYQVSLSSASLKNYVKIDLNGKQYSTIIQGSDRYHVTINLKGLKVQSSTYLLQLGDISNYFRCSISQLKINKRINNLQTEPSVQFKIDAIKQKIILNTQHMLPVSHPYGPFVPKDQIPNIQQLPPYSAPVDNMKQLYVCHDMMGGYKEDTNQFQNQHSNSYRFMYMNQCRIFNYFSHRVITIPPKHWRTICKRYGVQCLGTFIIENSTLSEQLYLTTKFEKYLIYLARKQRFDGYLINIQFNIKNIPNLKKWLKYLTINIHNAIPNSKIIWYDSISLKTGNIQYQNQLNEHNLEYLNLVDGFFTNYWWDQNKLKNTLELVKKNGLQGKVFIGNDCYGRNTYGGGKQNIYVATQKILEIGKSKLDIALFAPGYTYEGQPQKNRQLWLMNQQAMYRGMKTERIKINQWNSIINRGNGWQQQSQWAVTSYDWCERMFQYPVGNYYFHSNQTSISVKFMVKIMSTQPLTDNPYKIILQFYDKEHQFILHESQPYNYQNFLIAPINQQTLILNISLSTSAITPQLYLRVIEIGKSSKHWGGHFGSRFKKQQIIIYSYDLTKEWINKLPIFPISQLPYHSFCNMGHGDYFYKEGKKINKSYGYLSDQDIPHTRQLNHPQHVKIYYQDAYYGGTSLKFNTRNGNLIKVRLNDNSKVNFKIVLKLKKSNIYVLLKLKEKIVISQNLQLKQLQMGWYQGRCILQLIQYQQYIIELKSNVGQFLVGQISLSKINESKQLTIPKPQSLLITRSPEYIPFLPCYIDINLQCPQIPNSAIIVTLDNIHSGFSYTNSTGIAIIKNIKIDTLKTYELLIQWTNIQGNQVIIYKQTFPILQLLKQDSVQLI